MILKHLNPSVIKLWILPFQVAEDKAKYLKVSPVIEQTKYVQHSHLFLRLEHEYRWLSQKRVPALDPMYSLAHDAKHYSVGFLICSC